MKKKWVCAVSLCLAALLFAGCSVFGGIFMGVHYDEMEYVRPDMDVLQQTLEESCRLAAEAKTLDEVIDGIYAYYEVYDDYYTNFYLADIRYCADLTDAFWEREYNYCAENAAAADAGLEELYYALADSPFREELEGDDYFGADYFDAYEGQSIWDEEFVALLEQEAALESRYYELASEAASVEYYSETYFSVYEPQMGQLLVELVALRQQIAAYAGYESYPEFAYDFYYYRDYTPAKAESYLTAIGDELVELYRQVNQSDIWDRAAAYCSETATFAYVKTAAENMGGDIAQAFSCMEAGGLYDISYGENKYNSSFEVFLPSYYQPFVFMSPYLYQQDKLTFAHEFGHFVNDYVCGGSYAGADVAEVHSQAMEYLSLCYGEDTGLLEELKLADSLCVYVEQAAYSLFEQQLYSLEGRELTLENVRALYAQIGGAYGLDSWDWDSRDYISIIHVFTEPMYMVSYVVSNDVALQIYQLEKEEKGAGLEVYNRCVYDQDSFILNFVSTYGLEDPFTAERVQKVRKTMEQILE